MKNKLVLLFCLSTFFINRLHAQREQPYTKSLGVRLGWLTGVSYKQYYTNLITFEGIIGTYYRGVLATGLVAYQTEIPGTTGLYFFAGGGIHLGYVNKNYYRGPKGYYSSNRFAAGVDGIAGIEYKFLTLPLNISLDFKPFYDFVAPHSLPWDGAISVRYTFDGIDKTKQKKSGSGNKKNKNYRPSK